MSPGATSPSPFSWPSLITNRVRIPFLTSLGFRVVAPDMMGYGGTASPEELAAYTHKQAADDIAALAKHLGVSSIILGGHDWGGAVVYRVAIWYPQLIDALFSVCTPFFPPTHDYHDMAEGPSFTYQKQLRGPDLQNECQSEEKIRQFLNAIYGGRAPDGALGFSTGYGAHFDVLPKLEPTRLLTKEYLDFYASEYAKNGMRGPLNWYRTGELRWEEEKPLLERFEKGYKFTFPTLFIGASRDSALPPSLAASMDAFFDNLEKQEVDATHWALIERPQEVNNFIKGFLDKAGLVKEKSNI